MAKQEVLPLDVKSILSDDAKVFVAGVDIDGVLRGKLMDKDKFIGICENGFGANRGAVRLVALRWDIHDRPYPGGSYLSSDNSGFGDLIARPDLTTYRRLPWKDEEPFFLVDFFKAGGKRVEACPRGLLAAKMKEYQDLGFLPMCGAE
ncbi:MAG: hypothetical protein BJ554DRAFT_3818 [Olpidium bornovanus]|uniref:Glutamine synthetase n=1 Tax=Olpidium bornovanus TaxID=278681 RepID=A0A8H8DFZ6_9FUNG|nr:MAG: hypothetical protein BJ554DRAFT_3818 [Olpidium bornovanus]